MPDSETYKFYQVFSDNSPMENVTLEKGDTMVVGYGGTATGTIISGGSLIISEGGKGSQTVVGSAEESVGSCFVKAGGSADIVTVGAGGELYVSGRVTSAVVSKGGTATLYEDCQAKNFIISSGGELNLSAGATVYQISNGAIVSSNVIVSGGSLFLFEETWIEGVVFSGGYASIDNKAIMSSAIFFSGASATVRDGALVEKTTVNDGAVLTVVSGGVVKDTTLNVGGKITGNMYNCSGIKSNVGIIDFNIVVNDPEDGYFINDLSTFFNPKSDPMLSLYTITATMDQGNGTWKLIQDASGFAEDKTISIVNYYNVAYVLGTITIEEGTKTIEGRQYTLNLSADKALTLTVSGAPDLTGDLYETFDLTEGKYASSVDVNEGGKLNILGAASAAETTVHGEGIVNICDGGLAGNTTVSSGGIANVSAGGEANGVMVNLGGRLNVSAGGKATLVTENGGFVDAAGNVEFEANKFAGLALGDSATVHSGTTANKTVVNAGGDLHIYDGGRAENTTVNANGALHVSRGGVADGLLVMANGSVSVSSGTITGWIMLMEGATASAYEGAIIDFDLAQTAAGAALPLVNNLAIIKGDPAFTLTVTGAEATGTYNLAGSASGFNKTITVKNTLGTTLGTISVDSTKTLDNKNYTLALDASNNLTVSIGDLPADTTKPVVSNVKADITTPTNGNVTVTADFTDNVEVASKLFRFNDGTWQDYDPTTGVVVKDNSTVFFKAVDTSGNESAEEVYEVKNIDKAEPTVTVTPSTMEPTDSVTLTATFADEGLGLASRQYRISGGAWQDYTDAGVTVTKNNTTVDFKATDTAGNETIDSYKVTNINGGESNIFTGNLANAAKEIKNGSSAVDVNVNTYGELFISNGGVASNTNVNDGGLMFICEGGEASNTTVNHGGVFFISGGVVDRITVNEGGSINVSSGASVDSASILDGGGICVSKGATVTNLDASDGAIVTLDVAPDTYVQGAYAGSAFELKDAAISDYAIHHGSLEVRKDGVARRIVNEDGGTLRIYEGAILDGVSMSNGDLYIFEGAKATGKMELNGGYIYVHGGAVIDFDLTQTTPGAEALVSDLSLVNGTPSYTLTVSGSEVDGVYRLADGAAAFDQTITVMNTTGAALGTLTVGATQEIGGVKYALELNDDGNLDLTVGDPLPNWPDNGSNNVDKLWDKKAKKPVAGGIYYTVATVLGPTTSAVQIDDAKTVKNTVEEFDGKSITYTNFTGKITGKGYDPDTDDSDCRKIELSTGARLSFDVTAKSAGKFVIYQIDEKYDAKKGPTYTLKSVQSTSISLKKNTTYSTVSTKEVYLEKGTYYLSFESTIDKKKDTENFYNVELNCKEDPKKPATKFYVDDDSGDNNWLYDKKLKKTNSAVCGAAAIEIARNKSATIQVDKPEITGSYTNFVGFGDEYDYVKVHLSTGANLVFTVEAKDTAKFTISQLTYDKKTNTVSGTKAVQSTALKLDKATGKYTLTTKAVVLTEGDYYLSVQSSNAKKGGEAYYNVSVDGASAFFDNCDNHDNDFLYDKKQGGVNTKVTGLSALELNTSLKDKNIQVDTQSIHDETGWNNFVGYDDEADYTKFHVAGAGTASFSVVSTDAAKFVIYQLAFDKKGNVTGTKAIQTVTLKQNKTTGKYEMPANTKPCEFKEAGDYYLSVQSTNATKGGNAYYNVTLLDTNIAPVVTDALAMPETSDALAMTDSLSFGQYDADALTDASISAIADLDGKSAWQNIAPLA